MSQLKRVFLGVRILILALFIGLSGGKTQGAQAPAEFVATALTAYGDIFPGQERPHVIRLVEVAGQKFVKLVVQAKPAELAEAESENNLGELLWAPVDYFLAFIDKISLGYRLLYYLALLACFFLFNIASVVIVTVVSNWFFNRKEAYYKNKRKEIIEIVSPYFYDVLDQEEEAELVEKLKKYKRLKDRQIVIDVLIEGKRNFIGESSGKIKELYEILDLHKVSLRKVRVGNWYRRSVGLRELAFLGRKGFKNEIKKYINDDHQYVRTEAVLSYMLLDEKNPFGFLRELKYSFVRWDSLSIYYTMYFNGIEPPPMVDMLKHPDPQVRMFLLRMISSYNQLDAVKEVTKYLLDDDPEIRQEAVITLRSLEYYRIKALMKKRYADEIEPVRMEILRSMKHFIEDHDISFLEERVRKGSFGEVFEAVRILYRFSDYGERRLWALNQELKGKIEVFIKHVAEPRNKHVA